MTRTISRRWLWVLALGLALDGLPLLAQSATLQVTSFTPSEASTMGRTPFEVRGAGFTPGTRIIIDTIQVVPTFVDTTHLKGTLPAHTAGKVAAIVDDPKNGRAVYAPGVTYIGPLQLLSVRPEILKADVGGQVVLQGIGFTPLAQVSLNTLPVDARNVTFIDARTLQVRAPALDVGRYNVKVTEPGTIGPPLSSVLEGGLRYVDSIVPAPQQLETSLAEGTARFSWYNPVPYSQIEVLDGAGNVIRRLDGAATSLELPSSGADAVEIRLRGTIATGTTSDWIDAIAKYFYCNPQPLAGNANPGVLDLSIRGGHQPADVTRCVDGAGGGSSGDDVGAGAALAGRVTVADLGSHGPYTRIGTGTSAGTVYTDWLEARFPQPNMLVTGFQLPQDAKVLEFSGFYEKLASFPGLELRARIRQVSSPSDPEIEDGFTDELTFPPVIIGGGKKWQTVTYYRANKDVGHVPNPNDPNDGPPEPCIENGEVLSIPAGDYLLELYAVGADPQVQYFTFADDSRDYELLIREAPCPPYPLVKVIDRTGRKTLPVLTHLEANTLGVVGTKPRVEVTAFGAWLDEMAFPHQVGPGFPDNPDFEYVWTVYDRGGNPQAISSGSASKVTAVFQDWGCYYIDVTMKDKGCGHKRTQTFQIAVTPPQFTCTPNNNYFSFLYPTPEPSGICGIVGLEPPPGQGKMENKRPLEFSVLIAPRYYCNEIAGPAVFIGDGTDPDVEFTLATTIVLPGPDGPRLSYAPIPNVELKIVDLCPDVAVGLKYLHVEIEDINALPNISGAANGSFRSVLFVGRSLHYYNPANNQRTSVPAADRRWFPIGSALRLTNAPPALARGYWSGVFDENADTYYFSIQGSHEPRRNFPFGASNDLPLPIEGATQEIGIPSYPNDMTTGFNPVFKMTQEKFSAATGTGGTFGECFGNKVEGAGLGLEPTAGGGASLAEGGGGAFPNYEWHDCRTLFSQELSQTLFESILYTGTIGPVPVTVWASIGLGLDFLLQSQTNVTVNPFAALTGGAYIDADASIYSRVDISIPCEIRADVLFGVASIAARLIPQASVTLKAHVGALDTAPRYGGAMDATMSLFFEVEACIWALVDEICYSPGRVAILENESLIHAPIGDGATAVNECEPGSGGGQAEEAEGGGALADPTFRFLSSSRPGVAVSPSGLVTLHAIAAEAPEGSFDGARTLGLYALEGQEIFNVAFAIHDVFDPAVAFPSNTAALIAWTRNNDPGIIPVFDPVMKSNAIAAEQDIILSVHRASAGWHHSGEGSFIQVSDVPADQSGAKRADGMAAISPDQSAAAQAAGGQALVAWVRYDGPFLVQDGTRTQIYNRVMRQQGGRLRPYFDAVEVDTTRPNLEHTAIYARRVGTAGVLTPPVRISPAGIGINLEPTLCVSPSGATAYCVWVHDSSVDPVSGKQHVNLTDSNLGRVLMYSVYSKATGAWSAPQAIATVPSSELPGALEPSITLRGDHQGLLAFTALGADVSQRDSGLLNNRYVFACRLEGGVFGEPILVHGKCLSSETGHWPVVAWAPPLDIPEIGGGSARIPSADYVVTYLGTGPTGTRSGSGNVMMAALSGESWTAPRSLTRDDDVHSNLLSAVSSLGEVKIAHLNGGSAKLRLNPQGTPRTLQRVQSKLLPDAAVAACRLSDAFAAPGSRITATVDVENLGLAGTATSLAGSSLLEVAALYIGPDGKPRQVATSRLPSLAPGEKTSVALALEVPHEPVTLRIAMSRNPGDADAENDSHDCPLGAPSPLELACRADFSEREDELGALVAVPMVRMTWSNAALYDELRIYRDGSMASVLSGDAAEWVDPYAVPGEHVYEVRGLLGASKSRRAVCRFTVPSTPPANEFRRGDSDLNGIVDITDPIRTLSYLFLGTTDLACEDAADADDDGELSITDAIRSLGFLFVGSTAPPAPGPFTCGEDPTVDSLGECASDCR